MGKDIVLNSWVTIPKGVTVTVKSRQVSVKGPRGVLSRSFRHQKVELNLRKKGTAIEAVMWFANRKHSACLRTITAHIKNMIVGVTQGYKYKMRLVYAHFPINVDITENGDTIELRNFVGEKVVRTVKMSSGVTIERGEKDELILTGNDLDSVSQDAANINTVAKVRNKDIRKFLDGVYVSETGNIVEAE
jgi:large subunit ribosomal protein L9e